jgi:hypothetical protein
LKLRDERDAISLMQLLAALKAESECLRGAIRAKHCHAERNHQGLENRLIRPEPGSTDNAGAVHRHPRLGRILNYYDRAAA